MMFVATSVFAWSVIGLGVGCFGMMADRYQERWGLLVNVVIGFVGGVLGGLVGRPLGVYESFASWGSLATAAVGAIVLVGVYQLADRVWHQRVHPTPPAPKGWPVALHRHGEVT